MTRVLRVAGICVGVAAMLQGLWFSLLTINGQNELVGLATSLVVGAYFLNYGITGRSKLFTRRKH